MMGWRSSKILVNEFLQIKPQFSNNNIRAFFSLRSFSANGEAGRSEFAKIVGFKPQNLITPIQTHSTNVNFLFTADLVQSCDGVFTNKKELTCSIQVADCMPIYFAHLSENVFGLVHAGWRGLASGIIENLIKAFNSDGDNLVVHLGPAISKKCFEVGDEVKSLYLSKNINFERSFTRKKNKNYLDLYDAARVILEGFQINSISGGDRCTFQESNNFFSYRRDGINSGRMAHLIWIT